MSKDLFEKKSKTWDQNSRRVKTAQAVAQAIVDDINPSISDNIIDFGAGTGLLSAMVAPYVNSILAIDSSASMLEVFKEKSVEFACQCDHTLTDIDSFEPAKPFDGIVSSMTMHHIESIPKLFKKLFGLIKPGGYIAIADLVKEDGSFHSDNTGVFHWGFEKEFLEEIAKEVGFEEIKFRTIYTISKPHRDFDLFLFSAKRPTIS